MAVSQRVDIVASRDERRDALDQRLSLWLMHAGYIPVQVPNLFNIEIINENTNHLQSWLKMITPEAIVLSGGNNLNEIPERDHTERYLLTWAIENSKPVLGICRGMQMMGVWSGGKLKPVMDHVRKRHHLQGTLVGEVNSFHDLAIDDCPTDYEVLAFSEDGEIEAIHHTSLPWEAWMWHPEREIDFQQWDIQRLITLFGE